MPNRSRKNKLALLVFLVCASVLSFYTFRLAQSSLNFMKEIKTSDEYLRDIAWWILAYADEKGTFPRSNAELLSFMPEEDLTHSLSNDKNREVRKYPLSTAEARARRTQNSDIDYLLQTVTYDYADQPDLAPVLSVNQRFEERDRELVNSWLKHAQEHLKAN